MTALERADALDVEQNPGQDLGYVVVDDSPGWTRASLSPWTFAPVASVRGAGVVVEPSAFRERLSGRAQTLAKTPADRPMTAKFESTTDSASTCSHCGSDDVQDVVAPIGGGERIPVTY